MRRVNRSCGAKPTSRLAILAFLCCWVVACDRNGSDASVPEESAVSPEFQDTVSSDRNLAEALLYRWWGIFEAGDGVDVSGFFDDLFTADVYLNMPGIELNGFDAIKVGFSNLSADLGRSHQLAGVSVSPTEDGQFQLDATFTYQIARPDGHVEAGHSSYRHQIVKQPDGTFRLAVLTAELGEPLDVADFEPSYARNRARGTITQYLGLTDLLHSNYEGLREVMSGDAEVLGMFDPAVETHNARGDGALIGLEEIAAWLSTRKHKFRAVAHAIDQIAVAPAGESTYQANVVVDVTAQPKTGEPIEVRLPIQIMLRDEGGRFMLITSIKR